MAIEFIQFNNPSKKVQLAANIKTAAMIEAEVEQEKKALARTKKKKK